MTCTICAHPNRPQIDQAIEDLRAATAAGRANTASYGGIARQFGVPKSSLFRHRDECLAAPPAVGMLNATRGHATPALASTPAPGPPYALPRPPPRKSEPRASVERVEVVEEVPTVEVAPHPIVEAGHPAPTLTERLSRARGSPTSPNTHDRTCEIAKILIRNEWRGYETVELLMSRWNVSRDTIIGNHRQACALVKISRGEISQEIEASAVRWKKLYEEILESDSKTKHRDAAEALKGYDRAIGLVDQGAKVQVNIAQSPQGQELVRQIFEILRDHPDPGLLPYVRAELVKRRAGDASLVEAVTVDNG